MWWATPTSVVPHAVFSGGSPLGPTTESLSFAILIFFGVFPIGKNDYIFTTCIMYLYQFKRGMGLAVQPMSGRIF